MAITPMSLRHPSNFIDCLRKAELEEQQQAASLVRPKGYVAPDPPYEIEDSVFQTEEVLPSQTEDEECAGDPNNQCDDADCLCHLDCEPSECDTCQAAWIDQAEREADFAREME